ncbi:MAG TPA: DinB family protein [Methylomirabilota bacterium]|nr:DinB family protein [Methylomirabilota bacterium]
MDRRHRLLLQLERAWTAFNASYAGLSDAQLMQPGVTGEWSVRDSIAHVTTWDEEALEHLPLILRGGTPPRYSVQYGGLDAFNALMTERKRGLTLAEVRAQAAATHARLVELVAQTPEHQLGSETRFRHRLRLDTYGHYPLHAEAIRQWRQQRLGD